MIIIKRQLHYYHVKLYYYFLLISLKLTEDYHDTKQVLNISDPSNKYMKTANLQRKTSEILQIWYSTMVNNTIITEI